MTVEWNTIWKEKLKDFYDTNYLAPIVPSINSFLLKHGKTNGALLDIGCGYGVKSNIFSTMGFTVSGIDYSKERIDKAQLKFPNLTFMDYEIKSKLPFDDNSFDVIFSHSVFQYLDHDAILNECKRVLKKDGCLILIENLKNNPITRAGRGWLKLRQFNYQSFPHNHFTYTEINNLKNKFESADTRFYHLLTPLSHIHSARKFFPFLHRLDNLLLKSNLLKRVSWITLFTSLNSK